MTDNSIYVTRPLLPDLESVNEELKEIWASQKVTNAGPKHNLLEDKLREELKVPNVSLFNNGTMALLTALKALDLPFDSEVITTPFTFAATPHCISWNGLSPVFCDIEPNTMCINPDEIEKHITEKTSAILGVHVYGFPCQVEKIQKIADKYGLKVIYDGAHVFSTEINGEGIGNFGDITMFSFHATKLFNTIEGGCLSYKDEALKRKIYNLRNFGIRSEEVVEDIGINGKMNEIQAVIGLLNLKQYRDEQEKRRVLKEFYDSELKNVSGIRILEMPAGTTNSYQYYPIVIEDDYPLSRDELYNKLRTVGIYARKYFYPLCSDYVPYKDLPSSNPENLPVANEYKNRVLCLPFYGSLEETYRIRVCKEIKSV